MLVSLRRWLRELPIADPIERQIAPLVQLAELVGIALYIISSFTILGAALPAETQRFLIIQNVIGLLVTALALALLRRGRFTLSVALVAAEVVLSLAFTTFAFGLTSTHGALLLSFAIPVVMTGLLLGRGGLLPVVGASIAIVLITLLLHRAGSPLVGFAAAPPDASASNATTFVLIIAVLAVFVDRFDHVLRSSLRAALRRERELEHARDSLETTVAERTATLQESLATSAQRADELQRTLAALEQAQATLRDLSAPVIPVLRGVLVVPLIGELSHARTAEMVENVLQAVEHHRAHHVIFDVTGVPLVDTHVAQVLVQAADMVRLLGARALLVGIRPDVAQTLVTLGCNLGAIQTHVDLQDAVTALLPTLKPHARRVAHAG